MKELQKIIWRFLATERRHRSPEFYLLVLLLLFPEEQPPLVQDEDDEEAEQPPTDGQTEQLPLDHGSDSDLQLYVTFMEEAYERSIYAKYLPSRCLLPLFFLGKGSGLSKWIHKSQLDAIVEQTVDAELAGENDPTNLEKASRIENMWSNGDVCQVPEIQNILLPVSQSAPHLSLLHSASQPHLPISLLPKPVSAPLCQSATLPHQTNSLHLSLLHSASQPHLLIRPTPYTCLCSTLPVSHTSSSDQLPTPVSASFYRLTTPSHQAKSPHL